MHVNRYLNLAVGCGVLVLACGLGRPTASHAQTPSPLVRRVNAPYFGSEAVAEHASAIFWLGRVMPTDNYADMRVGYNQTELVVQANVFDRRVWYSDVPAPNDDAALIQWDAVTIYLDTRRDGVAAPAAPTTTTYRITVQANWPDQGSNYMSVARGTGVGYAPISATLNSDSIWRGDGPNNDVDDRGYFITLHLPFASLGQSAAPAQGNIWRMGVQVHDRDDAAGTPQYSPTWPETLNPQHPDTWGVLGFGLSPMQSPMQSPILVVDQRPIMIRHKLNGATVTDATVGGGTTCADNFDYFAQFGSINRAGEQYANVQNQGDVADWPCFSKFYLTFPLDQIPADKTLVTATLTVYQFGNSGQGVPPPPVSSLIQAMIISETWQEADLTWNTAPLALENISMARALPMAAPTGGQPLQSVPLVLDISQAIEAARRNNAPLRVVLYSADGAQNSGKYFWTSDVDDGLAELRPTLNLVVGTSLNLANLSMRLYLPIARRD